MRIKKFSTIFILFAIIAAFFRPQLKTYEGFVFGTYYSIKVYNNKNFEKEIGLVLKTVNNQMSVFEKNSEINLVNNQKESIVSDELAEILMASKKVYTLSNGAFDPSVGPLVELWGFGVNKEQKVADENAIKEILNYVGLDKVKIIGNKIFKEDERLRINLSAIAKGYAVDEIALMLDENGIKNYLIDIGGEVKAKGKKHFGKTWKIGIANPINPNQNKQVVVLNDMAVATSGNYQNFFIIDGKKYSHTINAITGKPFYSEIASATVFDNSCMMADAYATAIMAMSYKDAISFIKANSIKAIIINNDGSITNFYDS